MRRGRPGAAGAAGRSCDPRCARRFSSAVRSGAARRREQGKLVTFGIVAQQPETGYGYIRRGEAERPALSRSRNSSRSRRCDVARAVRRVGRLLLEQRHVRVPARRYLEELAALRARHRAQSAAAAFRGGARRIWISCASTRRASRSAAASRSTTPSWKRPRDAVVVPLDAGWSDVGSWSSLFEALPADAAGQCRCRAMCWCEDTHDCYVHSTSRLVAAVGLDDHVVVETKDAVLVAPKERVQDVKKLVARLKEAGRYESLAASRGVPALGQLRQHRQRRALPGEAPVGQAGRRAVAADASSPRRALDRGAGHRAHHPRRGDVPARGEPVDLHSGRREASHRESRARFRCTSSRCSPGSYLGEDDIVRFEDDYGRQGTTS